MDGMRGRNSFWFVIIVVVIAAYLCINPDFFRSEIVEYGDAASNAIRIRNAKAFREIYGNYSRWGFYHPGPAFFYLYAWCEAFLYDWLRIVGSPAGAHLLGSLVFQVGCSVVALGYTLRTSGMPAVLPLAMAGLVAHWHFMIGAPLSVWPPHVLFGPMLLLLSFAAGLAAGDRKALPVVVFAGAMLVHGHVAQPLMVVPIFATAIAGWVFNDRVRQAKREIGISAGILLIFLTPLAIDAARGADSNIAAILRHIAGDHGEGHTVSQGLGYLLSFFRYETGQEAVQGAAGFSLTGYIAQHWRWWPAVGLPFLAGLAALRSPSIYLRRYAAMVGLAVLLSTVWSIKQDGEMYDFNGNFIYAVIFAGYLLVVLVIGERIGRTGVVTAGVGMAALVGAVVMLSKTVFDWRVSSASFTADMANLSAFLRCAEVRFDPKKWHEAVAVINMIDRRGVPFRVDPYFALLYPYGRSPPQGCPLVVVGAAPGIPVPPIGGREQVFVNVARH